MTDQTGPMVGEETSPFPARYGPVRGAQPEVEPARPARRQRAATTATPRDGRQLRAPSEAWGVPLAGDAPAPARLSFTDPNVPVRRLVRRLDAWTVFKVSLFFYILMLAIVLVAGVVAWQVAVPLHFIRDIEKAVRTLADDRKFVLHPMPVLKWSAAAGGALALLGTVMNTIAAILYNLISDVIGGVQTIEVARPEE